MPENTEFDTDVIVVGTGPAGATTALALAKYGVRTHMVSKWNWLANTPRAHITNQRAMEVLRDLGVEDEAKKYATPWEFMGDTMFTTSLVGEEIARIRTWGTGDQRYGDYLKGSPCGMADIPQTLMEPVLVKNAAANGADVSFNTEYLSHEQDADGVTVRLLNKQSGTEYTQRARYLVGADGAKSKVAQELDLPFEGQLARAGTVYILFTADLRQYVEHRPSILHWIMNPAAGIGEIGMATFRAIRPWDQWILGWGFDITAGEPDLSEEFLLGQIRTLTGIPDLEVEIDREMIWYVNQQHAELYHRGRIFCAGDAVHRHPPSSGLGSNTCMQDAFNLAWKLAFAVNGWAGQGLLDSYSDERVPVGRQIVARANQSRKDYAPIRAAISMPEADDPVAAGVKRLKSATPEGVAARRALYEALELKNTEFNAQGVELNQRYASSAVIPDPTLGEEEWVRDRELYLQATTRPGAKIPHAWLVNERGVRVSTLDVTGGGRMSLVTGLSGTAWAEASARLDVPYLRTVVIGAPEHADLYGDWNAVSEIDEAGALLVRPDGYIAWRQPAGVHDTDEAERQLTAALAAVLGAAEGNGEKQ
ncbi:2,4-dichlorophenol 6-monooxygenase [Salinibacterium sp. dk2585]|uniref:FAD-dependent oxidoreductase n=1 Tax=unclassified Salinibacterium TaxID=2632331 RepID=UPI0011C24504|nr:MULTISPECIES: FAD-dependent monooxygenase [unclassified Salinibacterium]QEE60410.1 2,4-dichlorophenol 6-monooxygenase [Salinibacterium sp. dk2585]TXK55483.1 FAD-dependent monooxygenase [Salinibacterium sp. dk5596]